MSMRPTCKQWEIILNYMEANSDMISGRCGGPNGKQTLRDKWAKLSAQLNSLGYGMRNTEKWMKTWADFKYNLKKKAAEIRLHSLKTGGGPAIDKNFNEFEERALQLLGTSFATGLDVKETGLPKPGCSKIINNQPDSSATSLFNETASNSTVYHKNILYNQQMESNTLSSTNENGDIFSTDHNRQGNKRKSNDCNANSNINVLSTSNAYENALNQTHTEHSYSENKKRKNSIEDAYMETIIILKQIERTVDTRLGEICHVLKDFVKAKQCECQKGNVNPEV